MNNKHSRINEDIKRELTAILRDLKDPRIPPLVGVVSADVTRDLRYCNAYVSVMGGDAEQALEALKSASGHVRSVLAQRLKLRNTPEVTFHLDTSAEYGAHINEVLKTLGLEEQNEDETEDDA